MSFIKVPFAAFQQRYPAAARDLYVGLLGLHYRKSGRYTGYLKTSCDEIMAQLHLPRRTVWRRMASAEACGLIKRLNNEGETAPLVIAFGRPWASTQAAPCAENGTVPPDVPPNETTTGASATQTGALEPSISSAATQKGPAPVQVTRAVSGTPLAPCAENGTLLKSVVVDSTHPDQDDQQQQILPERAENGTPLAPCAENGTANVLEELLCYLDDDDVARELADKCSLGQVQRGIIHTEQIRRQQNRLQNPKGLLVKQLRQGQWGSAAEIPAEVWDAYVDAGYRDWTGRLRTYLED